MKCDKCGADMQFKKNGLSIEWNCLNCGHALVTTNSILIEEANKMNTIYVLNGDYKDIKHIKFISKIKNINYIQSRNLLKNCKKIEITSISNRNINYVIQTMDRLKLEYIIK